MGKPNTKLSFRAKEAEKVATRLLLIQTDLRSKRWQAVLNASQSTSEQAYSFWQEKAVGYDNDIFKIDKRMDSIIPFLPLPQFI